MIAFEEKMRQGGSAALRHIDQFFQGTDLVHQTLHSFTKKLDSLGIPYAVAGDLAMKANGHAQTTIDVDILLTSESKHLVDMALIGTGYVPAFDGSRNLRDTQTGVRIKFLITGEFPGDGKPKPIVFPDPTEDGIAIVAEGIRYLRLEKFIELKLASGMTNPNRLKDLADVQELIKAIHPPRSLGDSLHEFVRGKFYELWDGLRNEPLEQ